MIKMSTYLKTLREDMPSWLADYHPGDYVAFSDFMSGRLGYYPGCSIDGSLIRTANRAHCVHSFLYVDYGVTREVVKRELGKENAFLGYHSIGRVEWPIHEILPSGRHMLSHITRNHNKAKELKREDVQPFCLMEIYERNQNKEDSWGAERFALTYLFADGIDAYYQLFVEQYKKAPWLFLLQDHGFGNNYNSFGKGGKLHRIIHNYDLYPDFVINDSVYPTIWDGYHRIPDVKPIVGGMWRNERGLYARNKAQKTGQNI